MLHGRESHSLITQFFEGLLGPRERLVSILKLAEIPVHCREVLPEISLQIVQHFRRISFFRQQFDDELRGRRQYECVLRIFVTLIERRSHQTAHDSGSTKSWL